VGLLEEFYQHDVLWPLPRSEFNETEGYATTLRLATPASLTRVQTACRKKYYAYSAIAALFAYIERDVGVELAQASLNFRVVDCDTMTLIGNTACALSAAFSFMATLDYQTNKALGLIPNGSSNRSGTSLFQALCSCRTLMGRKCAGQVWKRSLSALFRTPPENLHPPALDEC
jgi:DNA mismatch repair ATPase MutS